MHPPSSATVRPTCPRCGGHDLSEIASTRIEYDILAIADAQAVTGGGWTAHEGAFDGFLCRGCQHESEQIADFVAPDPDFEPHYEPSRHGGWHVVGVRRRKGGVGRVSRDYPDRLWRIACDPRDGDHTYRSRDEAARAEYALLKSGVIE